MKAIKIEWDVDHEEDREALPTEIEIPVGMEEDEISDYLSDLTGYCHKGYQLVDEAILLNKTDILKEIKHLVTENLRKPDDNVGYTMPDGKHHIFISVDDIGTALYGEELIYRIEPNTLDADGAAEPMADVYTADFGDFAELLIGCMWCMDLFEMDIQQQKGFVAPGRIEVDLGYATSVDIYEPEEELDCKPKLNEIIKRAEGKVVSGNKENGITEKEPK